MNNKRIFITGGASGFGKAVAIKFASKGFNVLMQYQAKKLLS